MRTIGTTGVSGLFVGVFAGLMVMAGCGGPECADGTVEEDGECVMEQNPECPDGELFDAEADDCVAKADLCDDATRYDADQQRCVTAEEVCGANTRFEEGNCVADDPVECGGDTQLDPNENECYQTQEVCGDNTAFASDEDRCVPTDEVCQQGTSFDEDFRLCYPDAECKAGDVILDGECVSQAEAYGEDPDYVADGITDPTFEGQPVEIDVGVGDKVVVTGTIEEPTDLTGGPGLEPNQHRDFYEFGAEEGDWFEITLYSLGLPDPAFSVLSREFEEGEEPVFGFEDVAFARYSSFGAPIDKKRRFAIPADGDFLLTVLPGAGFEDWIESGDEPTFPRGNDDWDYVATVERMEAPDALDHEFGEQNVELSLTESEDNFFVTDEFEAEEFVILEWLQVFGVFTDTQIWLDPETHLESFDDHRLEVEVPVTGEIYVVFDWVFDIGLVGEDVEIEGRKRFDLEPDAEVSVEVNLDDRDGVSFWQTSDSGGLAEVTIEDEDGNVLVDGESESWGLKPALSAGDYTVTFENNTGDPLIDFRYDAEVVEPFEIVSLDVGSNRVGDIAEVEIEQEVLDSAMVGTHQRVDVYDEDDELVKVFEADDADEGRIVNLTEQEYSVVTWGPALSEEFDESLDQATVEYAEPEVLTDFDEPVQGSAQPNWLGDHDFYEINLSEAVNYEIGFDVTDGSIAGGRVFIYLPDHEEVVRTERITPMDDDPETFDFLFQADTNYVLRVGNAQTLSDYFDYELTFEE